MKLRTELKNKVAGGVVAIGIDGDDVSHDLLAAHALLQAMDEVGEVVNDYYVFPSNGLNRVRERADEILKEWTGEAG